MDFFIPGVPLEELRNIGLRLQRGGIGFYPGSGSPFVHLDVGSVRHWPSISREELVRIFPNGRTVHVPSDGRPLSGYASALADVERRGNQPSSVSLNAARHAGVLTAQHDSGGPAANPLAKLFGFLKPEREQAETTATVAAAPKPDAAPPKLASATKPASVPAPRKAGVQVAAALPPKTAAFSGISVPWPDRPDPIPMMPERALAYAALPGPELNTRPASPPRTVETKPLPPPASPAARTAAPANIPRQTSIVVRQPDGKPAIVHTRRFQSGEPFDNPWMRAAILAPSLARHMTVSPMGAPDYRSLDVFMRKPTTSVTMAFSADPNPGLMTDRFSGQAVVFVNTTTFSNRTAMLR
jgi:hypothetical protein